MSHRNNQFGFTLIEVLVAVSILVVISLGVIQLLVRSKQVADTGREKFVATNLAREGLELVRALRDTNWFTDDDRSHWIADSMCSTFTYDVEQFQAGGDVGDEFSSVLFIHPDGSWSHAAGPDGVATPYSRELEVDCSQRESGPAQVVVTSRVSWEGRGGTQEVVLKDKLYNWLP